MEEFQNGYDQLSSRGVVILREVEVVGRWQNIKRKIAAKFTNERCARAKILINYCNNIVDRLGMKVSRNMCSETGKW